MIKGLAVLAVLISIGSEAESGVSIRVTVDGARTDDGKVIVKLHDQAKGFPGANEIAEKTATLEDGACEVVFEGVTPGTYAVSLIHDEDDDGELKTNLIGIPREGIGTSNNVKPRFAPPSFEKAKLDVGDQDIALTITMLYL